MKASEVLDNLKRRFPNEHNDSGGYKGKYDVEIDRFAVYKQHVA